MSLLTPHGKDSHQSFNWQPGRGGGIVYLDLGRRRTDPAVNRAPIRRPSIFGLTTMLTLCYEHTEKNSEECAMITSFQAEIRTLIFMHRDAMGRRSGFRPRIALLECVPRSWVWWFPRQHNIVGSCRYVVSVNTRR